MANPDETALISLAGLDDSRRALLELIENLRRTLYLYTPLVRADLYNDPEVLAVAMLMNVAASACAASVAAAAKAARVRMRFFVVM